MYLITVQLFKYGFPLHGCVIGLQQFWLKVTDSTTTNIRLTIDKTHYHQDQSYRYVSPEDGLETERFLTFLDLKDHSEESITDLVFNYIPTELKIDFRKCRVEKMSGNVENVDSLMIMQPIWLVDTMGIRKEFGIKEEFDALDQNAKNTLPNTEYRTTRRIVRSKSQDNYENSSGPDCLRRTLFKR
ncbi:hypothetical protein CDAR_306541 [Caerostris darwini]|uniref:Uncharacterized protein n=1 Tax=Caerostris darwini TaxID=1538125 RepID=A0AAV4MXP9_9ARAC|nr:hypothetical protein CDAR_306541 [Caerostris darwini]